MVFTSISVTEALATVLIPEDVVCVVSHNVPVAGMGAAARTRTRRRETGNVCLGVVPATGAFDEERLVWGKALGSSAASRSRPIASEYGVSRTCRGTASAGAPAVLPLAHSTPAPVDRPLNQLLAPRHVPILSSAPPRSPALSLASCDTLDRVEQRPRNHALSRRPDVSVPHPAVYRRTR